MENWAEIRRLLGQGLLIKAIVRKVGVSRSAVRGALAAQGKRKYVRPAPKSVVGAVELQIRVLARWPSMPAT